MPVANKFEFGLVKSGEEGCELGQVLFKMITHDDFEWKDGNPLYEKLVEEFGDVMASTDFAYNYATPEFRERVDERIKFKLDRYQKKFADGG